MMVHSKYGYEPPEWVQADARLDKWYENRKRPKKRIKSDACNLEKKRAPVLKDS
ncbi:hypothetical protein IYO1511_c21680 [Lactiplantibacillus plantarum]|nr:hypothetical protein IYO1511_c21680 [Lactiplantibacillus plantarum]